MAKEEWGVKRACPTCGVKFYDLAADPVICPACEGSFARASLNDRKQTVAAAEKPKPKKAASVAGRLPSLRRLAMASCSLSPGADPPLSGVGSVVVAAAAAGNSKSSVLVMGG